MVLLPPPRRRHRAVAALPRHSAADRYSLAQLTRFLPDSILDRFQRVTLAAPSSPDTPAGSTPASDLRKKIAAMWE